MDTVEYFYSGDVSDLVKTEYPSSPNPISIKNESAYHKYTNAWAKKNYHPHPSAQLKALDIKDGGQRTLRK